MCAMRCPQHNLSLEYICGQQSCKQVYCRNCYIHHALHRHHYTAVRFSSQSINFFIEWVQILIKHLAGFSELVSNQGYIHLISVCSPQSVPEQETVPQDIENACLEVLREHQELENQNICNLRQTKQIAELLDPNFLKDLYISITQNVQNYLVIICRHLQIKLIKQHPSKICYQNCTFRFFQHHIKRIETDRNSILNPIKQSVIYNYEFSAKHQSNNNREMVPRTFSVSQFNRAKSSLSPNIRLPMSNIKLANMENNQKDKQQINNPTKYSSEFNKLNSKPSINGDVEQQGDKINALKQLLKKKKIQDGQYAKFMKKIRDQNMKANKDQEQSITQQLEDTHSDIIGLKRKMNILQSSNQQLKAIIQYQNGLIIQRQVPVFNQIQSKHIQNKMQTKVWGQQRLKNSKSQPCFYDSPIKTIQPTIQQQPTSESDLRELALSLDNKIQLCIGCSLKSNEIHVIKSQLQQQHKKVQEKQKVIEKMSSQLNENKNQMGNKDANISKLLEVVADKEKKIINLQGQINQFRQSAKHLHPNPSEEPNKDLNNHEAALPLSPPHKSTCGNIANHSTNKSQIPSIQEVQVFLNMLESMLHSEVGAKQNRQLNRLNYLLAQVDNMVSLNQQNKQKTNKGQNHCIKKSPSFKMQYSQTEGQQPIEKQENECLKKKILLMQQQNVQQAKIIADMDLKLSRMSASYHNNQHHLSYISKCLAEIAKALRLPQSEDKNYLCDMLYENIQPIAKSMGGLNEGNEGLSKKVQKQLLQQVVQLQAQLSLSRSDVNKLIEIMNEVLPKVRVENKEKWTEAIKQKLRSLKTIRIRK